MHTKAHEKAKKAVNKYSEYMKYMKTTKGLKKGAKRMTYKEYMNMDHDNMDHKEK